MTLDLYVNCFICGQSAYGTCSSVEAPTIGSVILVEILGKKIKMGKTTNYSKDYIKTNATYTNYFTNC